MNRHRSSRRHGRQNKRRISRLQQGLRPLRFELLEDRRLLSVYQVTTTADTSGLSPTGGTGTQGDPYQIAALRSGIEQANVNSGADTITFAASLSGQTITLGGTELAITQTLTIDASALTDGLTIDANDASRVLNFTAFTGDLALSGLTLQGGKTTGSNSGLLDINLSYSGAAVRFRSNGNLTLDNCTVRDNHTEGGYAGGGAVATNSGNVTITNSTLSGNSTTGFKARGGAVFVFFGDLTIVQSTVSGNLTSGSAAYGGGIFSDSVLTLLHSTVTGNQATNASTTGGGIFNGSDPLIISGSIVAGNTAGGGSPDLNSGGGTLTVNYSLIGDTSGSGITGGTGTGNILDQDPLLGPLADNGGPTMTHALGITSPALNAGDPAFDPDAFTPPLHNDQRGAGFSRVTIGRIDMGAFEIEFPAQGLIVSTNVDELDTDFSDDDLSLREAIFLANFNPGADTITFRADLAAETILLGGTQLNVSDALTIDATSLSGDLTIDANQQSRVFYFSSSVTSATLAGLTVTGGSTSGSGFSYGGGGIFSDTLGDLTIDRCTIIGNSVSGHGINGGGILARNLTLTSSLITGNSLLGTVSQDEGAGVNAYFLTMIGCTVSDNHATSSLSLGGGVFSGGLFGGSATIIDSTISGNSAKARGGGLYSRIELTLINSTISGNSQTGNFSGGGIYVVGNVVITQSTITGNSANSGGGIVIGDFSAFYTTISNSIIAGNTSSSGATDLDLPPTASISYSLIGDNTGSGLAEAQSPDANGNLIGSAASNGIIVPMLGPLADNGGPTMTHALLLGSLAINGGDPDFDPNDFDPSLDYDQRGPGFPRVHYDVVDMGAFEFDLAPLGRDLVVDTADDEFDGDFSSDDLSLREAIFLAYVDPENNTITFDAALSSQSILLSTELEIRKSVIIDASALAEPVVVDAQQNSRVFNVLSLDGDLTIVALVLQNGNTSGDGGAIRFDSQGILTVTGSTLTGSSADNGGAIFTTGGGTTYVTGSTISINNAINGGGIYSMGGSVVEVSNSEISGNSAVEDGGGIASTGPSFLYINQSTFADNDATDGGGLLARDDSTVHITESSVLDNDATDGGGGLANFSTAAVTIENSTFWLNSALGGGAIDFVVLGGDMTILGSTFTENAAGLYGGAILQGGGDLSIANSTLSGNTNTSSTETTYGGAIYNLGGTLSIASSTISGNSADYGGGIRARDASPYISTTILNNTIIANSVAGGDLHGNGTFSGAYNLIGDGLNLSSLTNTITGDPLLDVLADNGGPTMTHALLAGSPALDAGDPNFDQNDFDPPLASDQRGLERVADGGVNGVRIDIGAFEAQAPLVATLFGDYNQDKVVDAADYTVWRDTLESASTSLPNDFTPGAVDESDFFYWREHFGETLGTGSGAATTVPEPIATDDALADAAVTEESEPVAAAPTNIVETESRTMVAPASAGTNSGEPSATEAPTANRAFFTTPPVHFVTQATDFITHRQSRQTSPAYSRISQFLTPMDDRELLLLATAKARKERTADRDRIVRAEPDENTASKNVAPQDAAALDDPLACALADWR